MRCPAFVLGALLLSGCTDPAANPPAAGPPTPKGAVSSPAATPSATNAVATAAKPADSAAADASADTPLFIYVENGDELAFWPPASLRLVRSGPNAKTCVSKLSSAAGNMWTGPDVERAFAKVDNQGLLSSGDTHSFHSHKKDSSGAFIDGSLTAKGAVIEWRHSPCASCAAASPAVRQLQSVVAGVMLNRRLLCAE